MDTKILQQWTSSTSAAPWLLSLCSSHQNKRREREVAYPCMKEMEGYPLLLTACVLRTITGQITESKLYVLQRKAVRRLKITLHCAPAYGHWPSADTAQAKPLTDAASGACGVNACTALHCTVKSCLRNNRGFSEVWSKYSASHKSSCHAKAVKMKSSQSEKHYHHTYN